MSDSHPLKSILPTPQYLDQEIEAFLSSGQLYRFQRWGAGLDEHDKDRVSKYIANSVYKTLIDRVFS